MGDPADINDNVLSALTVYFAVFGNKSHLATNI